MKINAIAATTSGRPDIEQLLRRSFIFRDLDAAVLQRLSQLSRIQRLPRGAVLFRQGDDGNALFGVIDGLMRISMTGPGGKELTLGLMEPGDMFGEIALLDGLPRTASAEAVADTTLLAIDRRLFMSLLCQDAGLARHIIELLCERLRQNTDHLGEYAFLSLRARLAKRLGSLAIAHGSECSGGIRIGLKLSQTELAQMLGVTREAVNKQLQNWTRQGVLRMERGYITLSSLADLAVFQADNDN